MKKRTSRSIVLCRRHRRRLSAVARRCRDAALRTRYLIVVRSAEGRSAAWIADALGCAVRTVTRVRRRWREDGEAGLIDRREDGVGPAVKADDAFLATLVEVLRHPSTHFGHRRPTWTLRLLIQTMKEQTGVTISRSTMSRRLRQLRVRLGRPKPTVAHLGWSKRRKNKRLSMIRQLVATLPPGEAAVWEDEVDLDLNPRIGPDWMLPGTQREVPTPGKNVKRYLAGALDATTGRVTWVKGDRKNSALFIAMLKKLLTAYADRKVIHVILDNYKIHSSKQVRAWLTEHGGRLRLHFLPPYCPDDNRIERCVWRELHQNVTYNHRCNTIEDLIAEAIAFLIALNRKKRGLSERRKAI